MKTHYKFKALPNLIGEVYSNGPHGYTGEVRRHNTVIRLCGHEHRTPEDAAKCIKSIIRILAKNQKIKIELID